MNTINSILRVSILLTLTFAGAFLIFGEPHDSMPLSQVAIAKLSGILIAYIAWRLHRHWRNDPFIAAFHNWCERDSRKIYNNPNPLNKETE